MCSSCRQNLVRAVDGSHDLSSIAGFVIAFYRYILENDTSLVPETDLNSFQSIFLIINTAALLPLISGKPFQLAIEQYCYSSLSSPSLLSWDHE